MRALPFTLAMVGFLGAAHADDVLSRIVVPPIADPGKAASGSSAARPLPVTAEPSKGPKAVKPPAVNAEEARRMMMLLMMRDAASGFPAVLLRPAE